MESLTKITLSPEKIGELARHAFGPQTEVAAINEMKDGWFNTAYGLTISPNGRSEKVVLKIGPPAGAEILTYEKDIMRTEVDTMNLVAGHPDIPCPAIQFSDFSHTLLPNDYYFMEFLPGKPLNQCESELTEDERNRVDYQLGRIHAAIHTYPGTQFGFYAEGNKRFNNWPETIRHMFSILLEDKKKYPIELPVSEADFWKLFDQHEGVFKEVEKPCLVHWDLWAGNIFIDRENKDNASLISGVVDFERTLWGDPLMESIFGHWGWSDAFKKGYDKSFMATENEQIRRLFYDIYLYFLMIIEDGPRQYEDKGSIQWARDQFADRWPKLQARS